MNAGERAKHIVQSRIEGYQITRHPWSEGMIAAIERAIIEGIEEDRKTRECCQAEREASSVPILALQMILSRQRAIRGLPDFDEKVFSVAYFVLNHLGKIDQEPDPIAVERIRAATSLA